MNINEAFPGKYLKAADLKGHQITVTISHVDFEDFTSNGRNQRKPVLYFINKERGVVLNKTNATNIAALFGDEMNEWRGRQVVVYESTAEMQGRVIPCIRIKAAAQPKPAAKQDSIPRLASKPDPISSGPPQATHAPLNDAGFPGDRDMNDDIPF